MELQILGRMLRTARERSGISEKEMAELMGTTVRRIREMDSGTVAGQAERYLRYLSHTNYVLVLVKGEHRHVIKCYKNLVSWVNRRCWEGSYVKYAERLGISYKFLKDIIEYRRKMSLTTVMKILEALGYEMQLITKYGR